MGNKADSTRLKDLGERRIISELIAERFPRLAGDALGIGDDAAVIPQPPSDHNLVFTSDPCPTPVICLIEKADFYHYGRMTAVVNVSDLAAMGATPLGMLVATVMPEEMLVSDFTRYLDGLADASSAWNCPILGGNIKDGLEFTANGFAIGTVARGRELRRSTAKAGDSVCVIGNMGLFWAAILARMNRINVCQADRAALNAALYQPMARIREGMAMAAAGWVHACMDSSDGVSACLRQLAVSSCVNLIVDSNRLQPAAPARRVAKQLEIDPRSLALSWGNWELVCTIPSDRVDTLSSLLAPCTVQMIGHVEKGEGQVLLEEAGRRLRLANFASDRFSPTSMFTHGIESYVHSLKNDPVAA